MKITKITLHLSKRLAFNGIKTLTYTPDKLHQLILGTNGSGKSSLMSELSPLPANPADFFSGGYKLIELTHRGRVYTLMNDFSSKGGGKHSFICDGEELNPGNTVTVQKQLVMEHFQLDTELFELLTGVTNFREMSPTNRRKWLVRMADDNMSDALAVFNQAKSDLRDKQAVAKHLSDKLVDEALFLSEYNTKRQALDASMKRCEGLHNELQTLLFTIPNKPVDDVEALVNPRLNSLKENVERTLSLNRVEVDPTLLKSDTDHTANQLKQTIELHRERIYIHSKEVNHINSIIQTLTEAGVSDITDLKNKQRMLLDQMQTVHDQVKKYRLGVLDNVERLSNITSGVRKLLQEAVSQLPDNSDSKYTRKALEEAKQHKETLNAELAVLNQRIAKAEHILSHFNEDNKTACPKCGHGFYLGVTQYDPDQLKHQLNAVFLVRRDEIAEQLDKADTYIAEVTEYLNAYRRLTVLMDDTDDLSPLWEDIRKVNLQETHPHVINHLFDAWVADIDAQVVLARLTRDLENVNVGIARLDEQLESTSSDNHGRLQELQREINLSQLGIQAAQADLATLERVKRIEQQCEDTQRTIDQLVYGLELTLTDYEQAWCHRFIRQEMANVIRCQGSIMDEINDLQQYRNTQLELHKQHKAVLKEIDALKVLIEELSPVNGLIADYSLNFVKQFTDQMNDIISAIWTYDMQILPSAMNDDLTYKFPLYMSESDTETPDINRASTAQKGVIDFAFKLLLINYLGLEDYPLYIDELTPNLDEAHRINIMAYVRDFVESGKCSQMFMISHYVEGNNVFPQADFTIINDSNLLNKPMTYNKQLQLVYQ